MIEIVPISALRQYFSDEPPSSFPEYIFAEIIPSKKIKAWTSFSGYQSFKFLPTFLLLSYFEMA